MATWYDLKAAGNRATLYIYGDIVSDKWLDEEVSANSFIEDLAALGDITDIDLHINSPGGNVFSGIAIYTALRTHPAMITAYVDGVAASIASVVMCGADQVLISDAGMIMVHNPWAVAIGDADDLRKQAEMQDKAKLAMINAYSNRVGMTDDEIAAAMDNETWYTADEAVALGWADDVIPAAKMAASFDLSHFQNAPKFRIVKQTVQAGDYSSKLVTAEVQPMTDKATESTDSGGQINVTQIEAAAEKRALEKDKARRDEIAMIFSKFPIHAEMAATLQNDLSVTPEQASKALLAKLGEDVEPISKPHRIDFVASDRDKFLKGAELALSVRSQMGQDDASNEFRGCSLLRLAEHSLELAGVSVRGMSKMDIAGRAFTAPSAQHSTSDFSLMLGNVANKAMLLGYEEAPENYAMWTRAVNISDFKTMDMVGLSEFSDLDEVKESGEYTHGTFSDRREQITLATYGRLFNISRQAIINDDLMGFTAVPRKMGRAAARQVGDLAWGVLTANAAMADGTALFHADHSNLQASGAAPTTITVDAARSAMAIQTDSSGNANLNIRPSYALVPNALYGQMSQVISSETEVSSSQNNSRRINYARNVVSQVISDARLDTANSAGWYLAADPNVTDTVVIGYLDGVTTPFLEQRDGWTVDGAEYKVRMDVQAKAADHRGLYYNDGVT